MDELHNNNKPKARRHFDKEFKRDAVRLYYLSTHITKTSWKRTRYFG